VPVALVPWLGGILDGHVKNAVKRAGRVAHGMEVADVTAHLGWN
jgi:hypothetical protein